MVRSCRGESINEFNDEYPDWISSHAADLVISHYRLTTNRNKSAANFLLPMQEEIIRVTYDRLIQYATQKQFSASSIAALKQAAASVEENQLSASEEIALTSLSARKNIDAAQCKLFIDQLKDFLNKKEPAALDMKTIKNLNAFIGNFLYKEFRGNQLPKTLISKCLQFIDFFDEELSPEPVSPESTSIRRSEIDNSLEKANQALQSLLAKTSINDISTKWFMQFLTYGPRVINDQSYWHLNEFVKRILPVLERKDRKSSAEEAILRKLMDLDSILERYKETSQKSSGIFITEPPKEAIEAKWARATDDDRLLRLREWREILHSKEEDSLNAIENSILRELASKENLTKEVTFFSHLLKSFLTKNNFNVTDRESIKEMNIFIGKFLYKSFRNNRFPESLREKCLQFVDFFDDKYPLSRSSDQIQNTEIIKLEKTLDTANKSLKAWLAEKDIPDGFTKWFMNYLAYGPSKITDQSYWHLADFVSRTLPIIKAIPHKSPADTAILDELETLEKILGRYSEASKNPSAVFIAETPVEASDPTWKDLSDKSRVEKLKKWIEILNGRENKTLVPIKKKPKSLAAPGQSKKKNQMEKTRQKFNTKSGKTPEPGLKYKKPQQSPPREKFAKMPYIKEKKE